MPILETVGPELNRGASRPAAPSRSARKFTTLPAPALEWNERIERETAPLYARIKNVVPPNEWPFFAPYVAAINTIKKQRNARPVVT